MPLSEKKTQFQQKKALFDIIFVLKRVFCLPFLHKIPLSAHLKLLTTYSLIFQTPPILQNSEHL